jgi:hypothetical protein
VASRSTSVGTSSQALAANVPPTTGTARRASAARGPGPATTHAATIASAKIPVSRWLHSAAASRPAGSARDRSRYSARQAQPSPSAANHIPQAWVHIPDPRHT